MGKGQLSDFFFFFSFCVHEFKKTDAQFQVHTNSIPCTLCSLTVQTLLLQRLILHTLTKYQCSSAFLLSNYVECDSNANFAKQLRIKHQNTVYKTSVTFLFFVFARLLFEVFHHHPQCFMSSSVGALPFALCGRIFCIDCAQIYCIQQA